MSRASIPHLLRVHFANLGHPDARLSPLTLDFQRENHLGHPEPLDSIIWAENGVGKSSIRALLFSLLHPNIHDVMRASNGPMDNRRYELFFGPKDTAYLFTEWAMPPKQQAVLTGFPEEPHTLVLGFAAHWPNQQQTTLSDLDRHFFMFQPSGSLTFERLPVKGLSLGREPVQSAREFIDWFKEETKTAEGRHTTIHKEWTSWLAELGLDPMIFAYQLRMNGGQGGILGLFKNRINSSNDFVHFFLETVLNVDAAADVVSVLNERKAHFEKKPQWEAEVAFVNEALPLLEKLQLDKKTFAAAEAAVQAGRQRAGALAAGLAHSEAHLKQVIRDTRFKQEEGEWKLKAEQERFLAFQDFRSWLRYQECMLNYGQAERETATARERHDKASEALRLVKAAIEREDWLEKQRECKAIEAELAARQDAHLDVENALRQAGTALAQVLDGEIKRGRGELEEAKEALAKARRDLIGNQKEYNRVKTDAAKIQEQIKNLEARMQSRQRSLQRLTATGALQDKETPKDAVDRWEDRLFQTVVVVEEAQEAQQRLEEKRARGQARGQERAVAIAKLNAELDQLHRVREIDEYRRAELTANRELRLLTGEDEVDLANAELPVRIRERIAALNVEIFSLNRRLADDKDTLEAIERSDSRLYPPPPEVAKLLRQLREELRVPAALGTEELDKRFPDEPEQAAELFTRDPARYMGLIVPDRKALDAIRKKQDAIQRPAFPVQISLADGETAAPPQDDVLALAPGHQAAFNRKAAAALVAPLRHGLAEKERAVTELRQSVQNLQRAGDELAKFLADYSDGSLEPLLEQISEKQALLDQHDREQQADMDAVREAETELTAARARQEEARQTKQRCESAIARLRDFLEDHESQYLALQDEVQKARELLHRCEDRAFYLESAVEEDHHLVAERQEIVFNRKTALEQKEEQLRGIAYTGGELADVRELTLTEAEHAYRLCLDRFKKVSEKDETLRARLEEKQAMAREREARFRKELGEAEPAAVEAILAEGPPSDRLGLAEQEEQAAAKAVGAAEGALASARDRLREAPTVNLDYVPPEGESKPRDVEEAKRLRAEVGAKLESWRGEIDRMKETIAESKDLARRLHEDLVMRELRREELKTHIPDLVAGDEAELPRDNDKLKKELDAFWENWRADRKAFSDARLALNACADKLRDLANDARFQAYANDKRAILANRESLMRLTDDIIEEFQIFRSVIENSLRMSEESTEAIVTRLDASVSDALYLLSMARQSSKLPDSMEGWGGLSFLKIDFLGEVADNLVDRRPIYERVLRQALETGRAINGLELIKRSVDALAGEKGFRVVIMKPGYALKTDYHPVTEVKGWSDGEKITSVILLYCTMVQLRALSTAGGMATETDRALSNGMLFLDNPFGEANSMTFVNMQLSMARALNIQLVYTASGNHKHLMARFPRVIRLSQEAGEQSGKTFVAATDVGGEIRAAVHVTSAQFGRRAAS